MLTFGRPHSDRTSRSGFALFGAIVIVAIIAVMATVITVNLTGDNDAKRIAKVADILKRIEVETDGTTPSFKGQVGKFPGKLSQLARRISNPNGDADDCGTVYTNAIAGNWKGPYHIFPMEGGSYTLAQGFIANDPMERSPAYSGGTPASGFLSVVIPNVSLSDAKILGIVVDRVNTGSGPYVAFSSTNPTTVRYKNPITSGC